MSNTTAGVSLETQLWEARALTDIGAMMHRLVAEAPEECRIARDLEDWGGRLMKQGHSFYAKLGVRRLRSGSRLAAADARVPKAAPDDQDGDGA